MLQQPEKADAEAESQRTGHFRLVMQGRVIQAQLGERIAECFVVLRVDGKQTGEYPRLDLLNPAGCRGWGDSPG